jgi:hypothetical protein
MEVFGPNGDMLLLTATRGLHTNLTNPSTNSWDTSQLREFMSWFAFGFAMMGSSKEPISLRFFTFLKLA